uniref:saccharopine dehydrogenase NADP-binding domain-containing protein n=1 Tax=Lysinibacillus fusiformis TaxID=28031 RepID=UPI00201C4D5E
KVESVFLGDIDVKVAQDFVVTLDSNKVEVVELHAERDDSLMDVMSKGDVVVNALIYSFNERVARAAIEAGVHSVDLGGH